MSAGTSRPRFHPETEVVLYDAFARFRPLGVRRNLHMMSIVDYVSESMANRRPSAKEIWDHLATMYDIEALNDMEEDVFAAFEGDFELPESEFGQLMGARRATNPANDDAKTPGTKRRGRSTGGASETPSTDTPATAKRKRNADPLPSTPSPPPTQAKRTRR